MIPIVQRAFKASRLAAIHAAETTLKLRLGKVARSIGQDEVMATLVGEEADFSGYPAGGLAITYVVGHIEPDGTAINEFFGAFLQNAVTIGNTIYYVWIDNGADVVMACNFDAAIPMVSGSAALKLLVQDSYPPGSPFIQVVP